MWLRRSSRIGLALTALTALVGALPLACGKGSYLFLGRRYAVERGCLETTTSIDVMSGDDPGNCGTRCVTAPFVGDGGSDAGRTRDTYLTVMCGPLPVNVTAASDALCDDAVAALARRDTCLGDGGSAAPLADAGSLDARAD